LRWAKNAFSCSLSEWARSFLIPQALFIQLRKCCNHPYLFPSAEPDFDGSTGEDLVQASGKLAVLDRLLTQLYAGGHRVVLFSQFKMMLDIFEDMMQMRGYVRMTRSSSHITTHVPSLRRTGTVGFRPRLWRFGPRPTDSHPRAFVEGCDASGADQPCSQWLSAGFVRAPHLQFSRFRPILWRRR
jgi:hypothetical protein